MSASIRLRDFRFASKGAALTLTLGPGQLMLVAGPSGSGKSRFLRTLAGLEKGHRGAVSMEGEFALAGFPESSRKTTPEARARRAAGRNGATLAAEALAVAGLWDDRKRAVSSLTPGQIAASELLDVLASPAPIWLIDGQLERLDPWRRASVWRQFHRRLAGGGTAVVATNSADLLPAGDLLLLWRAGMPAFVGSYGELARRHGKMVVEVEGLGQEEVRALCEPFEVKIQAGDHQVRVESSEGQAVAGRLLLEGYGAVRAVVQRDASPEELLLGLS